MYVYFGKLNWQHYAENETFALVLPNGPVRTGDPAYIFFQWTKDEHGNKKSNWFQNIIVSNASKTEGGDDIFTLKHHPYSWQITTQSAYNKLNVTMSRACDLKSNMVLSRYWKSQGETSNEASRVWTGKINWPTYAENEMAMFIVPEGFGEGKPVLSLWQWTKDAHEQKPKDPSFRSELMKVVPGAANGVKFTYKSFYELTCTWNNKTEKLAVYMQGGGDSKDLGEFALSALHDRHSHDFNPPESAPKKAEAEFRLPQVQPSLPRILSPMPFPRTLFETLTYAASFVDQAGYLAKCAEEAFKTLDADFHTRGNHLEASRADVNGLKEQCNKHIKDLDAQKGAYSVLEKRLADQEAAASAKERELNKKIQDTIIENKRHDAEDHDSIDRLNKLLAENQAKAQCTEAGLQKRLTEALSSNAKLDSFLKAASAENIKLKAKNGDLETSAKIQQKNIQALEAENKHLRELLEDKSNKEMELRNQLVITEDRLRNEKAACEQQYAAFLVENKNRQRVDNERNLLSVKANELRQEIKALREKLITLNHAHDGPWKGKIMIHA
ncbi:uncharacterized protein CTRU02_208076 [Colletotrichum truncatum]|uniref:Uncharacterized protein n=1 Tax=Colletotrichum truncatum TaxID=5467 RepID=A0ACC3YVF6_COLTU|nr:uncharacterized protein CTRU02_10925 [Colletotrichum truncatum]KAF6786427.1 hypothetical protein CTRU02_10925 [Colletotrichum truncatum]